MPVEDETGTRWTAEDVIMDDLNKKAEDLQTEHWRNRAEKAEKRVRTLEDRAANTVPAGNVKVEPPSPKDDLGAWAKWAVEQLKQEERDQNPVRVFVDGSETMMNATWDHLQDRVVLKPYTCTCGHEGLMAQAHLPGCPIRAAYEGATICGECGRRTDGVYSHYHTADEQEPEPQEPDEEEAPYRRYDNFEDFSAAVDVQDLTWDAPKVSWIMCPDMAGDWEVLLRDRDSAYLELPDGPNIRLNRGEAVTVRLPE